MSEGVGCVRICVRKVDAMSLYKRGGVWWLDVYVGAERRRIWKSTGTDSKIRAKIVEQSVVAVNRGLATRQQAMGIIDNALPPPEKMLPILEAPEFYRAWAVDEGLAMSAAALAHRVSTIAKFAMWARDNSRVSYIAQVTAPLAFAFAKTLGEGVKSKTKNAYIGELGAAWKLYMRHDKAESNPWPLVRVKRDRSEEGTGRAFTADEISRIMVAAGKVGRDWPTVVMVALYTGLRQGDATNLKWTDVDFDRREISLTPSKTAKHGIRVRIPLHESLEKWLAARRDNGSEYVAPARVGRVGKSHFTDGDKSFQEILADAKIEKRDERERLTFHCFRHTFVSRLAEAGVAPDVRMRLAGHTSLANHALYTHGDAGARAAIDALP